MTYIEKLKDPRWQKKRLEILERDEWRCRECGSREKQLSVHHRWYVSGRMPWQYPNSALLSLCSECHKLIEERDLANPQWSWERELESIELATRNWEYWSDFGWQCHLRQVPEYRVMESFIAAVTEGWISWDEIIVWIEKVAQKYSERNARS